MCEPFMMGCVVTRPTLDEMYYDPMKRDRPATRSGEDMKKLREIARTHIEKAAAGDMQAIKELADRLDGKPAQMLEHSGPDSEPITKIVNEIVYMPPPDKIKSIEDMPQPRNHLHAKQWEWKRRTQFLRSRQPRLSGQLFRGPVQLWLRS